MEPPQAASLGLVESTSPNDGASGEQWVPLAEIARPHGVKGELRLRLFNAHSDLLLEQDEVLVRLRDGQEHEVSVDHARRADDAILMKLHSIDDRNRALEIRGALICVKRKDFPPPDEDEFYAVDVVGAIAYLDGVRFATVLELIDYPSIQAFRIRPDDALGEMEVPMSEAFVASVDAPGKRVELLSIEGIEREPPPKAKVPKPAKLHRARKDKRPGKGADAPPKPPTGESG